VSRHPLDAKHWHLWVWIWLRVMDGAAIGLYVLVGWAVWRIGEELFK
jgi:hypothetical protein